jgi:hypothetical protein
MKANHTTLVQSVLQDAGYSFLKIDQHTWQMKEGDSVVAEGRSLGDLIREQGKELGVW